MAKLKIIDTIGELDEQIKALVAKRDKLIDRVKDYRGVGTYEGSEFIGSVYEMESTHLNTIKLKKKLGADYRKYLVTKRVTCMRVERPGAREAAAAKAVATRARRKAAA